MYKRNYCCINIWFYDGQNRKFLDFFILIMQRDEVRIRDKCQLSQFVWKDASSDSKVNHRNQRFSSCLPDQI